MGKYLNEEYDEVIAFSQEEMDAKIKEATEALQTDSGKTLKEKEDALAAALKEKDEISIKLTSRSDEYKNLKKKFDETKGDVDKTISERTTAYEKMRDSMITKAAGEDKEYAEKLRESYDRIGTETLDPTELEKNMKDAHALTLSNMDRDFTAFSLGGGATGVPPRVKRDENKKFTETEEGKDTYAHIMQTMGQTPKADLDKK